MVASFVNVQCPDCHGKGFVQYMQSPTAPSTLCPRCGGARVIPYRDPTPVYRGKYRLVKCDKCDDGNVRGVGGGILAPVRGECKQCHGEGAWREKVDPQHA